MQGRLSRSAAQHCSCMLCAGTGSVRVGQRERIGNERDRRERDEEVPVYAVLARAAAFNSVQTTCTVYNVQQYANCSRAKQNSDEAQRSASSGTV